MGQHNIYFRDFSGKNGAYFKSTVEKGLGDISIHNEDCVKNSQAIQYIENFLMTIRDLASAERANQVNFLQQLKSDSGSNFINNYQQGNTFKYLEFIRDLNSMKKDIKTLKQEIEQTKKRMETIKTSVELVDKTSYIVGKGEDLDIRTFSKKQIDQLYSQHLMSKYRSLVNRAISTAGEKITQTANGNFTDKVNEVIKNIGNNTTILEIIKQMIESGQKDTSVLKGAIINAILYVASKMPDDIKKITEEEVKKAIEGNKAEIETTMREGINNISLRNLSSKKTTLEKFLKTVIEDEKGGYAQLYLDLPYSQKEKLARLSIGADIFKAAEEFNKAVENGKANIQAAKGNFTKRIKEIINGGQKKIKKDMEKQAIEEQVNRIYTQIINETTEKLAKIPPINIRQLLQQAFHIDSIKVSAMAEIKNAVEVYIKSKGNIDQVFVPGDVIKLKNDFVFTYHVDPIKIDQKLPEGQLELRNLVTKQGQRFLQYYDNITHGSTDVNVAYQQYINTLKQIYNKQQELINTVEKDKQGSQIDEINKILDSFLVSVSVKQYQFYNDTVGYGAGSLGGGGKVVEAVPNLLNMMYYGGIDFRMGTELIINTLLNSFPESIIGTGYVEDITNFLLVGAAMMLFDDGFTSGKTFLENVKQQISGSFSIPAIHLILVDNLYFPQSYVLQNIFENLLLVYNEIIENADLLASQHMTTGTRAQLHLHNDIDRNVLKKSYDGKKGKFAWTTMSEYAENNVTISYFFMAGMVELLGNLGGILTIK